MVQGKTGLCGFTSTNLPFILQHNAIKNVALAGFLVSRPICFCGSNKL
jgi:hypothetical protein